MFEAVNQTEDDDFSIVWDLGRRCTFACTYCGPHHNNKWSPHASLDVLKKTLDGVVEYNSIMNSYRKFPKKTNLAFTGGEPTANPNFFEFVEYAHTAYPAITTNVTTNGCYSVRKCQQIIDHVNSCTISYHAEASTAEKALVTAGMELMIAQGYNFRVNLMFHKDYFDECVQVAQWMDQQGIKYTPRVIGDSGNSADVLDGTAHIYTDIQLQWFKDYWERSRERVNKSAKSCNMATSLGRPCCAGKNLNLLVDGEWGTGKFVPDTNFKGWNCMINWYFLYINSELDAVWHHQTCQVNLDGDIGPIGKASQFNTINDNLRAELSGNSIRVIRCPKSYCGCGLCASKAKNDKTAVDIFETKITGLQPILQRGTKDISTSVSIFGMLKGEK